MPSSTEIVDLLTTMSHRLVALAIGWHVVILALAVALLVGWRPTQRATAWLLVAPALSVALAALVFGNPFNAVAFGALAAVLAYFSRHLEPAHAPRWASSLGIALVAFGWGYPHFVDGMTALYAAPVGIVPCPTLAVMAGFTLLAGGFASRAVPAALTGWTAFYALFGLVRLHVALDAGLLVAMAGLAGLVGHAIGRQVAQRA